MSLRGNFRKSKQRERTSIGEMECQGVKEDERLGGEGSGGWGGPVSERV